MQLYKFDSYEEYIQAQFKTNQGKTGYPGFSDLELEACVNWLKARNLPMQRGLCHGARNGLEVGMFKRLIPESHVIGTDLQPYHATKRPECKGSPDDEVVVWDFSKQKTEWIGAWDFVYSNSLDHARFPPETLKVWLDQLKPGGVLFLQWVRWHKYLGGGDCFGAGRTEYEELVKLVGDLRERLRIENPFEEGNIYRRNTSGYRCWIFVVGRKGELTK